MAGITILPREVSSGERIGESFGQGLQTGLASLLNDMANQKALSMQVQKRAPALQQLLGLSSPEEAMHYAQLPENLLAPAIKEKIRAQNQLRTTGPGIKTIAPELNEQQAEKIGTLPPGVQQLWYRNYLQSPDQAVAALNEYKPMAPLTQPKLENLQALVEPQEQISVRPKVTSEVLPAQPIAKEPIIEKPKSIAQILKEDPTLTKDEAKDIYKTEIKQRLEAEKEGQKVVNDIIKQDKAAKENNLTLDKMEKLVNKGKLPPAALYKLVKDIQEHVSPTTGAAIGGAIGGALGKGSGGPIGQLVGRLGGSAIGAGIGGLINPIASLAESAIRNYFPDTEQFEKLSNSFIRGAKDIFGSRVTNLDLSTFLTTIPNLTQTDNGKRQIIENLRIFNKAAQVRGEALKDILKETKGRRPVNLNVLIEERANKKLDELAKDFLQNIPEATEIRDTSPVQWPWQQVLASQQTF